MKKIITLFSICLCFHSATQAQISKGSAWLGGSLGYSSLKSTASVLQSGYIDHEGSFAPKLGFGLSKNWVVGGVIELTGSKVVVGNSASESKNQMYKLGIFGRKFFPFNGPVGFFTEASFKYGVGKKIFKYSTNPEEKHDLNEYDIALYPGIYFKPNRKFFIEATIGNLGYTSTRETPVNGGDKGETNVFDFSLTNSLSLGFYFILGGK